MFPQPVTVIGGTGDLGQALVKHFLYHGIDTIIGSRKDTKAKRVAGEIASPSQEGSVSGKVNPEAAGSSEFVILAIPFWAHETILPTIRSQLVEKNVLDTSVPIDDDDPDQYNEPAEGSAGYHVREQIPDSAKLATGFHTLSAHSLGDPPAKPESDVFYCGNSETKSILESILDRLGFQGHDAGDLKRSGTLERLTPMLIHFNIQYDRSDQGFKLV